MSIAARRLMRSLDKPKLVVGPEKALAVPEHVMRAQTDAQLNTYFDQFVDLGIAWLRFDIYWAAWEVTQGSINYTQLDRIINRCVARGIKMLAVVHTVPAWARPATVFNPWTNTTDNTNDVYGPKTAAEQDRYVSFLTRVAQHYEGVIDHYEIWNEQNLDQFWAPTPNAASYSTLLQKSYNALKIVDPNIQVISGGVGGASSPADISESAYITAFYNAGGNVYADGIGVHPYTNKDGQMSGELWNARTNIRPFIDSRGDATKPIWATETGAPTIGLSGEAFLTEAKQATLVTDTFAYWRGMHHAGPVFWFTYADTSDGDINYSENNYGIIRRNRSSKPSYAALKNVPN